MRGGARLGRRGDQSWQSVHAEERRLPYGCPGSAGPAAPPPALTLKPQRPSSPCRPALRTAPKQRSCRTGASRGQQLEWPLLQLRPAAPMPRPRRRSRASGGHPRQASEARLQQEVVGLVSGDVAEAPAVQRAHRHSVRVVRIVGLAHARHCLVCGRVGGQGRGGGSRGGCLSQATSTGAGCLAAGPAPAWPQPLAAAWLAHASPRCRVGMSCCRSSKDTPTTRNCSMGTERSSHCRLASTEGSTGAIGRCCCCCCEPAAGCRPAGGCCCSGGCEGRRCCCDAATGGRCAGGAGCRCCGADGPRIPAQQSSKYGISRCHCMAHPASHRSSQ